MSSKFQESLDKVMDQIQIQAEIEERRVLAQIQTRQDVYGNLEDDSDYDEEEKSNGSEDVANSDDQESRRNGRTVLGNITHQAFNVDSDNDPDYEEEESDGSEDVDDSDDQESSASENSEEQYSAATLLETIFKLQSKLSGRKEWKTSPVKPSKNESIPIKAIETQLQYIQKSLDDLKFQKTGCSDLEMALEAKENELKELREEFSEVHVALQNLKMTWQSESRKMIQENKELKLRIQMTSTGQKTLDSEFQKTSDSEKLKILEKEHMETIRMMSEQLDTVYQERDRLQNILDSQMTSEADMEIQKTSELESKIVQLQKLLEAKNSEVVELQKRPNPEIDILKILKRENESLNQKVISCQTEIQSLHQAYSLTIRDATEAKAKESKVRADVLDDQADHILNLQKSLESETIWRHAAQNSALTIQKRLEAETRKTKQLEEENLNLKVSLELETRNRKSLEERIQEIEKTLNVEVEVASGMTSPEDSEDVKREERLEDLKDNVSKLGVE